ncbi:HAD hydrolase family protein [Staphylococcus aureus]
MKFVFDIDGTLCFNGKSIDPSIIDSLLQLQHAGHELIFASARPIRDLLPVLPEVFHQHTLIGANLDPHKLASCINVANIDTPIKIILLNIDPAQITTILDELNKYHQELEMIHHSNEYNIDITAQNINKYTALQYIFDADVKYIAFGNDHNDIVMLQHASSGYIIGPSEAYTHAILKLDKIKHIDNNTQAICKVLKSYK